MIATPIVSIIIPSFNYGHLLSETLDSVLGQSFRDWECIVVDDGSTDNTGPIASAYALRDVRFSYVFQKNRGLSAARNAGLSRASARYLQLLDADDLIAPDKLRVQVNFLDKNESYALVYGPMQYFTAKRSGKKFSVGKNGTKRGWLRFWSENNDEMLLALVQGNIFPVSAPLFRKTLVHDVGYFDESLQSHEDWEYWIRCAFSGKQFFGCNLRGTETFIREHDLRMTTNYVGMIESRLEVRDRIAKIASSDRLKEKNDECANYDRCELGAAHLTAGHWRIGWRMYAQAQRQIAKILAIKLLIAHVGPHWVVQSLRKVRDLVSSSSLQ